MPTFYRRKTDRWMVRLLFISASFLIANSIILWKCVGYMNRFDELLNMWQQAQRSYDERAHSL